LASHLQICGVRQVLDSSVFSGLQPHACPLHA
jgi:hypothetical protein